MNVFPRSSGLLFESGGTANDFTEFAGNLGLTGTVINSGEIGDHLAGVFCRSLHGDHPEDLFADGGVEKTFEESGLEGGGDDLFKNLGSRREKLVIDGRGWSGLFLLLGFRRSYQRKVPSRKTLRPSPSDWKEDRT